MLSTDDYKLVKATVLSLDHKLPQLQTLKPLALERFPDQGPLAAVCERVRAGLVKYNYTKGQAQDKVDEHMRASRPTSCRRRSPPWLRGS